jgi:Asp-tRNA(Asn)/Glu-tRNA(Gln) amidotransferase C subunit
MDKKLEQMIGDFEKIMSLFSKMEASNIEDIESLKEEAELLKKDLEKRYEEPDSEG